MSASRSKAKFLWTFSLQAQKCLGAVTRIKVSRVEKPAQKHTPSSRQDADAKMKALTRSIILSAFLQICSLNPISYWTLLPNVLVVEVNGSEGTQPLSCLGSPEDGMGRRDDESGEIFWKTNGVEEEQRGNSYLVQLEESLGGGNYSCHREDGSLVNYTEVLIKEDETMKGKILVKTDGEDYLKCSARNYDGEFHCSWTWDRDRVSKVAFIEAWRIYANSKSHCSLDTTVGHWKCSSGQSSFSCVVDDSGNGISCVDEHHCPYAEESQQIYVNIYVRTEHFLVENYSKQFYLSDIVKPDKVRINKVNTTVVEWSYPSSWSVPYSYFPLTFQIVQLKRGCKSCVNPCTDSKAANNLTLYSTDICQFKVKHKAKVVCVRAKDALCNSQWSEWSHFRLRRRRERKRVRFQQTISADTEE